MTKDRHRYTFLVSGPEFDHVGPQSACYTLPEIPPPADFPVIVDRFGVPVSRYGEHKWLLGSIPLNFGTEHSDLGSGGLALDKENGELLKRCVLWLMYGDRRDIAAKTVAAYQCTLKQLFAYCSGGHKPIPASRLSRHFEKLDTDLAAAIRPSSSKTMIFLLNELWQARDHLRFALLSPEQIARLRALIPQHEVSQTQFIPPRIWSYQASQLRLFLEDFLAHRSQFETAWHQLRRAYQCNFGSLQNVRGAKNSSRHPCNSDPAKYVKGCIYLGPVSEFAERTGIEETLRRWLFEPGQGWVDVGAVASVRLISRYLSAVSLAGAAYIQCFTGMRIGECKTLRSNCLQIEQDSRLGPINIICGGTTKTSDDSDARWLAAPSAGIAVEAMRLVARWRTDLAIELGECPLSNEDRENPYLVQRALEPWTSGTALVKLKDLSARPGGLEISRWRTKIPGLFDPTALRVSKEDEAYVRRFSANADLTRYGEGCIWEFCSHQYRRTAAVMMGASSVSIESQQYQFKHLTKIQSAYYRKGSDSLRLSRSFTEELVSTRYELVAVEIGILKRPEYVSPMGSSRKEEILRLFELSSGDEIQKSIRKGLISVKQTLFGVCTRNDRCPYGGHDNFAHCSDCNDALLSRAKRASVERLGKTIAVRLVDVPLGTPLFEQLSRSSKAIEGYLNVTA